MLGLIIVGNSEMVEMNFRTNELRPSKADENRSHGQGLWIGVTSHLEAVPEPDEDASG
jgi:hypothetical protein